MAEEYPLDPALYVHVVGPYYIHREHKTYFRVQETKADANNIRRILVPVEFKEVENQLKAVENKEDNSKEQANKKLGVLGRVEGKKDDEQTKEEEDAILRSQISKHDKELIASDALSEEEVLDRMRREKRKREQGEGDGKTTLQDEQKAAEGAPTKAPSDTQGGDPGTSVASEDAARNTKARQSDDDDAGDEDESDDLESDEDAEEEADETKTKAKKAKKKARKRGGKK